jgi:hypothetical protein
MQKFALPAEACRVLWHIDVLASEARYYSFLVSAVLEKAL